MRKIAEIQYITRDSEFYSHSEQAELMYKSGISWVQLRMKNHSEKDIEEEAKRAVAIANRYNGTLIINDHVAIALSTNTHGVHLGLKDMKGNIARTILGDKAIIGGTANTLSDIQMQVNRGVDYIGLGPFRFTETKKNLSPIIGLEGYRLIAEKLKGLHINLPIVGVGGIVVNDIPEIKQAGLSGVAVSADLLRHILETNKMLTEK